MVMRFNIIVLLTSFCVANGFAQERNQKPGDWITVNLDMTDSMTVANLGFDVNSKLATKVLNIVSRNGKGENCKISCVRNRKIDPGKINLADLNTGILCRPKLEIYDEEIVDTGMEKLTVVKVSLSIFVQSVRGDVIFSSITKEYQGSGRNRKAAINNAIVSIPIKSRSFESFLIEARQQIVQYYNQICSTIINQAQALKEFKLFEDAIYLLWPIPHEVSCHSEARDTMISIYKAYVEYNCSNFLFNARTYITSKKYSLAMAELRKIDAEANCAKDAIQLMNEISAKVDEQERQYIDLYKTMLQNDFELERERNQALSNITKTINVTKIDVNENKENKN